MDIRIGHMEPLDDAKSGSLFEASQLFVIAITEQTLTFYAGRDQRHRDLAARHGAATVLGGGICWKQDGQLTVSGASREYGGLPRHVLEMFATTLQETCAVQRVIIQPACTAQDVQRVGTLLAALPRRRCTRKPASQ